MRGRKKWMRERERERESTERIKDWVYIDISSRRKDRRRKRFQREGNGIT